MRTPGVTVDVWIERPLILHRPAHADVLLDPSAEEERVRLAFGMLGITVKDTMAYATARAAPPLVAAPLAPTARRKPWCWWTT